jgi:hypothetical protein
MGNYDEDYSDPAQRCKHGTFIGSWWGPDYMCHWCELGVTDEEYAQAMRSQALYNLNSRLEQILPNFFRDPDKLREFVGHFNIHIADWMTRHVLAHADEIQSLLDRIAELDPEAVPA